MSSWDDIVNGWNSIFAGDNTSGWYNGTQTHNDKKGIYSNASREPAPPPTQTVDPDQAYKDLQKAIEDQKKKDEAEKLAAQARQREQARNTVDSILGSIGRQGDIHAGNLAGLEQEWNAAQAELGRQREQLTNMFNANTGENKEDRRTGYNTAAKVAGDTNAGAMSRLANMGSAGGSAGINLAKHILDQYKGNEGEANFKYAGAQRKNDTDYNIGLQQNDIDRAKAHDAYMNARQKEETDYYNQMNDLYNKANSYGSDTGRYFNDEMSHLAIPNGNWQRWFTGQGINYTPNSLDHYSAPQNVQLTTQQKEGGKW